MSTTNFTAGTLIESTWLNDVDAGIYETLPAVVTESAATTAGLAAHIADTTAAHAASAVYNTPAGNIIATTVQAAIDELDTEKQPLDAELTALAGLISAANKVPRFTGSGTAEVIDVVYGSTTPTIVGNTNVTSVGSCTLYYTRVGNLVNFAFDAVLTPTAAAPTHTSFYVPIPVSSGFTLSTDAFGTGSAADNNGETVVAATLYTDIAGDRFSISFFAQRVLPTNIRCSGTYLIK